MSESEKNINSGEFTKLCEISKNTLRWYEKLGLIHPKSIAENGYHSYSLEQFFDVDLIKMMKWADNSLLDVKNYIEHRSEGEFSLMMLKQQEILGQKLRALTCQKGIVDMTIRDYLSFRDQRKDEPSIMTVRACWVLTYPIEKETPKDYVYSLKSLYDLFHSCADIYNIYCSMLNATIIDRKDILTGNYLHRSYAALRISSPIPHERCREIPAGNYAVCYHTGKPSDIDASYEQLLAFIRSKGLTIAGDAIEFDVVNYFSTADLNKYQKSIFIPVTSCSVQVS